MSIGTHTLELSGQLPTRGWTPSRALARLQSRQNLALGCILALAAFLNLYRLDQEGYANTYYAAAVKSMLKSWHNVFFVSFDPGGFVSVDKPPLGFWIQALSAKLFGFSGLSLLLPEAVAGVLSVALLYVLVRRVFGVAAGLLAALVLAVSPIAVAVNRNNTIDALLILFLLAAVWAVLNAIDRSSLRWLLLGAVLVGLGFNIKMMQAYLVVPALGLAYLLGSRLNWRARISQLTLAAVVLAVVSLSWAVAVDLTPASQRPYVGSSSDNSALNLALGYNGLFRLLPSDWLPSGLTGAFGGRGSSGDAPQGGGRDMPGFGDSGPSALRLFDTDLAGQIAWLLPLAALGFTAAWWQTRTRLPLNRRQTSLVLWGTWLATGFCFFSVATSFTLMHRYYLAMMAPPIAALVGIGLPALWHDYRRPIDRGSHWQRLRGWLLPIAAVGTATLAAWILRDYPEQSRWLTPIVLLAGLGSAVVLALLRLQTRNGRVQSRLLPVVAVVGLVAILTAPTVWAGYTTWNSNGGALPAAGPDGGFGRFGPFRPSRNQGSESDEGVSELIQDVTRGGPEMGTADPKLIAYLEQRQQGEKFLFATMSSMSASPYILATGLPVAALGGFSGGDQILTTDQLAAMVERGEVRYFLVSSPQQQEAMTEQFAAMFGGQASDASSTPDQASDPANAPSFGPGGQSALTEWVNSYCTLVPSSDWQSTTASNDGPMGMTSLYDCASTQ